MLAGQYVEYINCDVKKITKTSGTTPDTFVGQDALAMFFQTHEDLPAWVGILGIENAKQLKRDLNNIPELEE
jgi:hypothetical protein